MRFQRILLINPPISAGEVYGKYASGAPVLPPLGFCYIAAVLCGMDYEVQMMDCPAEGAGLEDVRDRIGTFRPGVLGVTATTVSFHCAKQVLSLAKGIDPAIVTLLGGAHISAVPREAMEECPEADIGVYGEGEVTVAELMRALEAGGSLGPIQGICRRDGPRVVVNPPRPNVDDLDVLPRPARHLLKDLKSYSPTPLRSYNRAISLISSRGCTFACGYCDQSVFRRRWRAHGADRVIGEIKGLMESHGFDFFSFEDDHFLINRERVAGLCRRLIGERLGIGWGCSVRPNSVTPEVLDLMREAGCRIVYMGIETGSPRLLDMIDKGIRPDQIRRGVEMCAAHGIKVYGAFMIGLPTETPAEMDQTLEFALSLPLEAVSCFIYVPYPATPLRPLALRSGFVSRDWRDYSAHPTCLPFVQEGLTEGQLLAKQREFYRRFYLRPAYVAAHLPDYLNWRAFKRGAVMLKNLSLNGSLSAPPARRDARPFLAAARPRLHT